ncbi:VENN motif pre-toxin domain-containing protein, partial [Neisseria meningitidis]|nr:VENN motif pre-toxin domain-containing protein [Neisseria meningitidis]
MLEEGAHGKSPKCLGGNLGDFGEFCKGLKLSPQERQKVIAYSQIIAGSAVALVKGDVNTAA